MHGGQIRKEKHAPLKGKKGSFPRLSCLLGVGIVHVMRKLSFALIGSFMTLLSMDAQDVYTPSKTALMDAASYLQPLPREGVVAYKTIAGDFAANQSAACGKYGGRRITVVGRVAALSPSSGENKVLVVRLQGAKADLPAVKCDFLFGAIPQNSSIEVSGDGSQAFLLRRDRSGQILGRDVYLSVGQKVAIKGEFKGQSVGDIVLTACKLEGSDRVKAFESLSSGR